MKHYHTIFFGIFAVVILLFATSCGPRVTVTSQPIKPDGKYDIAYPFGGNSDNLKGMIESIRLINSTAYYASYTIPQKDSVRLKDISQKMLKERGYQKQILNDFSVGTATVIYSDHSRIAVLTCAHVVDFADTLVIYYDDSSDNGPFVQQIAFIMKQENFVANIKQGDNFKIMAYDRQLDVVVLGKEFLFLQAHPIEAFKYRLGHAKELDWGNLLYVAGFPSGKKMITTGIVSSPNRNRNHDFLLDALFNRGFSGGIVLAVRDGLPNFELVGLVNSVAADNELVLTPNSLEIPEEARLSSPYNGQIYVTTQKKIKYGISFGISIESIKDFLNKYKDNFSNAGFKTGGFFNGLDKE